LRWRWWWWRCCQRQRGCGGDSARSRRYCTVDSCKPDNVDLDLDLDLGFDFDHLGRNRGLGDGADY
jgi:hypothetical protein